MRIVARQAGGLAAALPEARALIEVQRLMPYVPSLAPLNCAPVDRGLPVAFPAELIQLASRHSPRIPERPLRIVAMRAARPMAALAAHAHLGGPQLRR